jgi:hypothetical protein
MHYCLANFPAACVWQIVNLQRGPAGAPNPPAGLDAPLSELARHGRPAKNANRASRRSIVAVLITQGVNIQAISELLGHSSVAFGHCSKTLTETRPRWMLRARRLLPALLPDRNWQRSIEH